MTPHGRRAQGGRRPPVPRTAGGRGPAGAKGAKRRPAPNAKPQPAPTSIEPPAGPFRLGVMPGATPGKWIDVWQQRMPRTTLELVQLDAGDEAAALRAGRVDAAIARLPLDGDGLHVIPLYRELPVVVCPTDSHLTAADELTAADLAGEIRIVPRDDVLGVDLPGTVSPVFEAPETTADAVATVAAGVGILVVPMSLARLHHRKDLTHRVLTDGPESPVGLAWPRDDPSPLVDVFVGIVRGRTANSSRG